MSFRFPPIHPMMFYYFFTWHIILRKIYVCLITEDIHFALRTISYISIFLCRNIQCIHCFLQEIIHTSVSLSILGINEKCRKQYS